MAKRKKNEEEEAFIEKMNSTCHNCGGSGIAFCKHKAGEALKAMRVSLRISTSEMSDELGIYEQLLNQRDKGNAVTPEFVRETFRAAKRIIAKRERLKSIGKVASKDKSKAVVAKKAPARQKGKK